MLTRLSLLLAGLFAVSVCAAADADPKAPANWEAGKNYFVIDPPQPTATGGKVEVIEVFSYACPHCAHFQPYAEQIKQALPAYAQFDYMPAIFSPAWEPAARAFYTAQSLGVVDKTHQAVFDALHRDHLPLRTIEDLSTVYAQNGVDKAKFIAASGSFEVESKLSRAKDMVKAYGVDGTPTIVVNGKYRVTAGSAGGYPQLIQLVSFLVEKEHGAKPAAKPAAAKGKK